jgi:hypothetical protein
VFNEVSLNRDFYFSYGYDLSCSLQVNLLRSVRQDSSSVPCSYPVPESLVSSDRRTVAARGRFVWNEYLLEPIRPFISRCVGVCVCRGVLISSRLHLLSNLPSLPLFLLLSPNPDQRGVGSPNRARKRGAAGRTNRRYIVPRNAFAQKIAFVRRNTVWLLPSL